MEGWMKVSTKQREGLALLNDPSVIELLVGGAAGGAKTFLLCLMAVLRCRDYPGAREFIGRRTAKSIRQSTLNTLLTKVHPFLEMDESEFHFQSQTGEIHYKNGSIIFTGELDYQPSDPDFARLGSLEIDDALIDEAGEITLAAKNAIKSRVGRGIINQKHGIPGKVILSCNPSQNFLRTEYYDPYEKLGGGGFQKWSIGEITLENKKTTAYRAFLRMGAVDNPFLPQSYIDTLATLPDRERKRLLDGNWDYADDESSLFRSSLLDKATTYELPIQNPDGKFHKFIGCDISDKGGDKTVFSLIDNGVLITQKKSSVQMQWDNTSEAPLSRLIADELIEFAQRNGFTQQTCRHIAVECNGVGVGVRDMLKERGWQITEYVATHKSRSEGYYQMMLDMDSGNLKLFHETSGLDEVRKQLVAHTFEMDNQQPSVVKKDKLKQKIGHSPDEADSLMIANYVKNLVSNPQHDPRRNANRISQD